jgi:hypothetical protein
MDVSAHQWPQEAQLVAAHPPQEDADARVVSPPPPLLTKPQEDMRRVTFLPLQEGQSGDSDPKTSFSKLSLQFSQQYSYIGMGATPKSYGCFVFCVCFTKCVK